jgi:hypothetical protein
MGLEPETDANGRWYGFDPTKARPVLLAPVPYRDRLGSFARRAPILEDARSLPARASLRAGKGGSPAGFNPDAHASTPAFQRRH